VAHRGAPSVEWRRSRCIETTAHLLVVAQRAWASPVCPLRVSWAVEEPRSGVSKPPEPHAHHPAVGRGGRMGAPSGVLGGWAAAPERCVRRNPQNFTSPPAVGRVATQSLYRDHGAPGATRKRAL